MKGSEEAFEIYLDDEYSRALASLRQQSVLEAVQPSPQPLRTARFAGQLVLAN